MENKDENIEIKLSGSDQSCCEKKQKCKAKFKWWNIPIVIFSIILIACGSVVAWYYLNISPVEEAGFESKTITLDIGSTTEKIAQVLEENKAIRNATAFRIYVKLNNVSGFQAGTYTIDKPYTIDEIIQLLKTGKVYSNSNITITFVEGKNMRYIAKTIASNTNNTEEDVFNLLKDEDYLKSIIQEYWYITDEINNENIYYPLEGYLFPDTYQFEGKDTDVKAIFKKMLDQTATVLDPYKEKITIGKHSVHELLTLASVIELEAMKAEDRAEVSGVFYNRLNKSMSLGSDVTTYYAYGVDMGDRDLYMSEINGYNPYNTRGPNMGGKLPVGPIASVSRSSIEAAINPKSTEAIYFVADKNGKIYFANTNAEHDAIVRNLKNQGLWFVY